MRGRENASKLPEIPWGKSQNERLVFVWNDNIDFDLKKYGLRLWTGLNWLRIDLVKLFFWTREWPSGYHTGCSIY